MGDSRERLGGSHGGVLPLLGGCDLSTWKKFFLKGELVETEKLVRSGFVHIYIKLFFYLFLFFFGRSDWTHSG